MNKNEKVWSIIDLYENNEIGFTQAIDAFALLNKYDIAETIADLETTIKGVLPDESRYNVIQRIGILVKRKNEFEDLQKQYFEQKISFEDLVEKLIRHTSYDVYAVMSYVAEALNKRRLSSEEEQNVVKVLLKELNKQTIERELELDCSDYDDIVSCSGELKISISDVADRYCDDIAEALNLPEDINDDIRSCLSLNYAWDHAEELIDSDSKLKTDEAILDAFGDEDDFFDEHAYTESDAEYDAMCDAADEEIDRRQEEGW